MTTTDLIKILKDTEYGGISHKPRNISLTINGKYMPDPRITLSSTGDGIAGPEIDLDIDGEFFEEQQPCEDAVSREDAMSMILCYGNEIKAEVMDDIKASMIKLPPVQPKPKIGYISIDDVMSVFDDFMCGEVDEDGTNTFLEMLKDKAESKGNK